ncbi:T9SS type A sorting domain-containing protein [candidate division KSB1 bacterium]|nr:T9SS type A sorting domain-containing protein [candidate division KSB1 bacterium]
MIKFILMGTISCISLILFPVNVKAQTGVPLLKIVKSEDGKVCIIQSREIQQTTGTKVKIIKTKGNADLTNESDGDALNNMQKSNPAGQAMNPGPDLDIDPDHCSFNYNSSTHDLTVNVRVINSGTSAADWNYLGYYVSTNAGWSVTDYRFGNDYVAALAPGSYSDETIMVDISTVTTYPDLPCGTHTYFVGFILDYTNRVAEDSEANFFGWSSPSITFPRCGSGQPNLTAEGQPASYNFNSNTCQLDINVRVINDGDHSAGASNLGYYLSSNANITTSDCRLGTDWVVWLDPGAYSNESIVISDICNITCVSNGTWYVGFIIDYLDEVVESDETDNDWYFTPSINVGCCSGTQPTCAITVTNPNGGEQWSSGSTQKITWTSEGASGNVIIRYWCDGAWQVIVERTEDNGEYDWAIPTCLHCDQIKMEVMDADDETCFDQSDGYFTISGNGSEKTLTVPFLPGWNMFSINVAPPDSSIETVLQPIVNHFKIVKDGMGRNYIPQYQINTIGNIRYKEGYQVYMLQPCSLKVDGQPVAPTTPIALIAGWNMISYLPTVPINAAAALFSIKDQLMVAKNNDGQVYIPQYNINTIGDMRPGQGYQVYLNTAAILIYPNADLLKPVVQENKAEALVEHFTFTSRTGENAIIVLPAEVVRRDIQIQPGDEIGAFTPSGLCCGAGVWQEENLAITIWGDDDQSKTIDGFRTGESMSFRLRRHDGDEAIPLRIAFEQPGSECYQSNGFAVAAKICSDSENTSLAMEPLDAFQLLQNYPNPFNAETTIKYYLSQPANVELVIHDLQGNLVSRLQAGAKAAGYFEVKWDGRHKSGLPATTGVYFCRLSVRAEETGGASFVDVKKMVLMR